MVLNTAPCRTTSSAVHASINFLDTMDMIDESTFEANMFLETNCAGRYLYPDLSYGYVPFPTSLLSDDDVSLPTESGTIIILQIQRESLMRPSSSSSRGISEAERMKILMCALQQEPYILGNKIHVQDYLFREMKVDICPFTGGGDVFISKSNLFDHVGVVCLARELDEEKFQ